MNYESNRHLAVFTVLMLGVILAIANLLVITTSILLLIFAGLIFGVFLNGLSTWTSRKTGLSHNVGYFIVVFAFFVMTVGGVFYLGSQIVERSDQLWVQLQTGMENAVQRWQQHEWASENLPKPQEIEKIVTEQSGQMLPRMMYGIQWIGWGLTGGLMILFVGIYAAYDPALYRDGVLKLVPMDRRDRASDLLTTLQSTLTRWIHARLMSMTIIGVLTAIGLWFLGVPLFGTLGVIAALCTFIPNIGPLLAAVPQLLLAINVGGDTVLYVLIFNIVLEGFESYLITPMIQQHEVSLPPILTICAQLLMSILFGLIGLMMAAPLVVVVMVLVQVLYIRNRLGDPNPGELVDPQRH